MEGFWSSTWPLALIRAIHFASCLLAFGVVAFDLWIAAPALKHRQMPAAIGWARIVTRIVWTSLLITVLSGLAWFALNAINMSGLPPREALQSDVLRVVLSETRFGRLWEIRSLIWLATLTAVLLRGFLHLRGAMTWIAAFLAGALAASLAWAGHGQDGNRPQWHLAADALHILIGGIWPVGLLPFTILFLKLRCSADQQKWTSIGRLTRRFSAASLISVALLAGTGLVNSFYMLDAPSDLVSSDYGKVLLAKIIVFLVMVGFGAMNLLRWKPRLSAEFNDRTPTAVARLQMNVALEAILSLAVLVLAGFLGTLSPPMDAMMMHGHHHHHSTSE